MPCKTIREARKAAHMTQEELAHDIGINRATLSKYESGDIIPPISKLRDIALVLGVDAAVFMKCCFEEMFPQTSATTLGLWNNGRSVGQDEVAQEILSYGYRVSNDETKLINLYWKLNAKGRQKAVENVQDLAKIPEYQRQVPENAEEAPNAPSEKDTTQDD